MTSMTEDYIALRQAFPHGNADDILETVQMRRNGTLPVVTDAQLERERQSLKKLEKALGLYEVASMLLDLAGPEAMGTALKRIEEQERAAPTLGFAMNNPKFNYNNQPEVIDEMNADEILAAMEAAIDEGTDEDLEQLVEKLKSRRKHGLHRTKVSDSRSPVNKMHRTFRDIADEPIKVFRAITKEGDSRHDGFEIHAENLDELTVNEGAMNILAAAARKTKTASDTIRASGTPSPEAVQAMLDVPTIRAVGPSDIDTRKALSGTEFAIEPTVDQSFGAIAKRTKAAASIARPSKIDFKDQED
jgi:hypothetical protein